MKIKSIVGPLVWIVALTILFQTPRSDFHLLWSLYSIAFASYAWMVFSGQKLSLRSGLCIAVLIRLISLFFDPLLSDDYYRFIWDGMVAHAGIHPMAFTPQYLVDHPDIVQIDLQLFSMLNSQEYYSVYPPVAQWIFRLSYWFNGLHIQGHIIFYKLLLSLTDAVICFLLYVLLKQKNLPPQHVLWYALNPLVILEFSGNLHMDGLMIAGLLGAAWLSEKKNISWTSIVMVLSVASKMVTLLLIPFFPSKMYWKKMIMFSVLSLLGVCALFGVFFGQHTGWLESVSFWFISFEFNASIYYIARSVGFWLKGYNVIESLGPNLAVISIGLIVLIWIRYVRNKISDWSTAMLMVMTVYYLMSTTVHPWYLGIVITLGVLSLQYFPIVWSYLVMLSYSHYDAGRFEENYWLIATEYSILFVWMIVSFLWKKKTTLSY